jgi:hypothetical protein
MFELLDLSSGITPALCELMEWVPIPILKNRDFQAKTLRPILENESYICTHAFNAFVIVRLQHPNHKGLGYDIFKSFLKKEENFEFPHLDEENSRVIPWSIFCAYWNLAKDDGKYWQPESQWQYGKNLPYEEIVARWRQECDEIVKSYSQELQK